MEHPFGAMPVSILLWRAEIGIFNANVIKYPFKSTYRANVCPRHVSKFNTICSMFSLLLICAGDIKLNPGSRKNNIIIFLCAMGILAVLQPTISQNYL